MIRNSTSITIGFLLVEIMVLQLVLITGAVSISSLTSDLTNLNEAASSTDVTPPTIENVNFFPHSPTVDDDVRVNATISDDISGVDSSRVNLYYRSDDGQWNQITMSALGHGYPEGTEYLAHIPKQAGGTKVEFYIEAYDNAENMAINDNQGKYYSYTVQDSSVDQPDSSVDRPDWLPFITILVITACVVMVIIYVKRKK